MARGIQMEVFQSSVKQQLLTQYRYKIEMHAHTSPASPCSQILPEEMVQIYSRLGYDAVVITNHFSTDLFEGLSKEAAVSRYLKDFEKTNQAGQNSGLKVILGAEIRFTENMNDYLLYGADKTILENVYEYLCKGLNVFRHEVRLERSVFLQAHPFRDGMELADMQLLDGIETLNLHPGHNSRVAFAARHAGENKAKITIAGSDFHHPGRRHEGVSAIRTKVLPEDSYALAELLKTGDYIMEIGGTHIVLP